MKPTFLKYFSIIGLFIVGADFVLAQNADIPPPETRFAVVAKINQVIESRGKPVSISNDCINPFTGKIKTADPMPDFSNVPVPVGLSGPELLSQLSSKIPSTGTLVFGGNAILLLGSKRVKVGETLVVNQDGKDYQLTLTAVTSTTFTVKMGAEVSTRPVRKR